MNPHVSWWYRLPPERLRWAARGVGISHNVSIMSHRHGVGRGEFQSRCRFLPDLFREARRRVAELYNLSYSVGEFYRVHLSQLP